MRIPLWLYYLLTSIIIIGAQLPAEAQDALTVEIARVFPYDYDAHRIGPDCTVYCVLSVSEDDLPEWATDGAGPYLIRFNAETGEVLQATKLPLFSRLFIIDDSGNAIFGAGSFSFSSFFGQTHRDDLPTVNAIQSSNNIDDAYVWKVDSNGNTVFATYLGGAPQIVVTPETIDFGELALNSEKKAMIKIENRGTESVTVSNIRGHNPGRFSTKFYETSQPEVIGPGGELEWEVTMKSTFSDNPGDSFDDVVIVSISGHQYRYQSFTDELAYGKGFVIEGKVKIATTPTPSEPDFDGILFSDGADGVTSIGAVGDKIFLVGQTDSEQGFPVSKPDGRQDYAFTLTETGAIAQSHFFNFRGFNPLGFNANGLAFGQVANDENFTPSGNALFSDSEPIHSAWALANLSDGSIPFATYIPDTWSIKDMALDDSGKIYITGDITSDDLPVTNSYQGSRNGNKDAFLLVLSSNGTVEYATYFGSSGTENANAISLLPEGLVAVAGTTGNNADFPVKNSIVEPNPELDSMSFVAIFDPGSSGASSLSTSTLLGANTIRSIRADNDGKLVVIGSTKTLQLVGQDTAAGELHPSEFVDSLYVIKLTFGLPSFEVCEILKFEGTYDPVTSNNKVTFVREREGEEPLEVEAEIVEVSESQLCVRAPVGILGDRLDKLRFPEERSETIRIRFERNTPGEDPAMWYVDYLLLYPRPLLYDEIAIPAPAPGRHVLPQFILNDADDVETFWFLGRSVDESAGLRIQNTILRFADTFLPLKLNGQTEVFAPGRDTPEVAGALEIERTDDEKQKLNISFDGLYVICVKAEASSDFPAPFQIHLSGDSSSPQKILDDGQPEGPRAIRQDILFNHPAPRWERLTGEPENRAQTSLFKFAKRAEVSTHAKAVLIPPAPDGFAPGESNPEFYIRRARDPDVPGQLSSTVNDPTNPVARTPSLFDPKFGEVIDFTQIPDPASAVEVADNESAPTIAVNNTVGAALGVPNAGVSVELPLNDITSLILDMGSGNEIVDGTGNDLRVYAVGAYTVAVANTPFASDFVLFPGTADGQSEFDLNSAGLTSVRFVRISASPTVQLDAVQALNTFYEDTFFDDLRGVNVPVARANRATFTARREKAPETDFDPVLELILPDGVLAPPIEDEGFGDPTSQVQTDAALISRSLTQPGFYRVLGRGNRNPNAAAFGSFFVRLETGGDYDKSLVNISSSGEVDLQAQRSGTLTENRERDSFIFSATPGQNLNIVVSGEGNSPIADPYVELHDPEGILIAANDNFPGRGRDAVISVSLPTLGVYGEPLPNPSAYRIIVSGIDRVGQNSVEVLNSDSQAYLRMPDQGGYSLKLFTGPLDQGPPDMRLSSTTLDFGEVTVGSPAFSKLTIFNDGVGVLKVSEIDINAGDNTSFTVLPGEFSLAPGGSRQVTIGFTPDSVGPVSADLTISSNDPAQLSAPVSIQANASMGDGGGGGGEEEASVITTSLSLRIGAANTVVDETTYHLFLDSGFGESEAFNQELANDILVETPEDFLDIGEDPDFPSHISDIVVESAAEELLLSGGIEINVPPAIDSDSNGIPDFFQPEIAVSESETSGFFVGNLTGVVDTLEGAVLTTWTRNADSLMGNITIAISITEGAAFSIEFNTTFELLVYQGTLTFVRDSGISTSGALNLNLENAPSEDLFETLSGDVSFTVDSPEDLELAGGELSQNGSPVIEYENFPVKRMGNSFLSGIFTPFDFPSPFGSWFFEIFDPNDGDNDGIPNFSDSPLDGGGGGTPVDGIEIWRSAFFGDDAQNPEIAGDLVDNDFDDSPTILEYALNTDPMRSDSTSVEVEFMGDSIALTFTRNPNANDIEYLIQESEGPAGSIWTTIASCKPGESWTSEPGIIVESDQAAQGPRIQVSIPLKGRSLYYRLLVRVL